MVAGIGVECVCLSGTMLAKAGTVLDVLAGLRPTINPAGRWHRTAGTVLLDAGNYTAKLLVLVIMNYLRRRMRPSRHTSTPVDIS